MDMKISQTTSFLTDKYELTMISAAIKSGLIFKKATFEAFARRLPSGRKYGVVAGIDRIRSAVKDFYFTPEQIAFLEEDGINSETLSYLRDFEFNGKISSYAEGDFFFPYSPVVTVEGIFLECVILETVILSILNYDCAVASAASRMVVAANGRPVQELGARRAHEMAAVSASRAAYITGFKGTSNMEAAHKYGVPAFGTSAHAFTLAHNSEVEAFKAQVDALGVGTTLLVDTYDTEQGIRNAVEAAGVELGAIRIDSGDLYEESVNARALLDSLGAVNTKIVVSSDLDEFVIEELMTGHDTPAPIDAFGAGTRVVTGSGHPTSGMVYKLVEIEDDNGNMRPVAKAAHGKRSLGGKKAPFRVTNIETGEVVKEIILMPGDKIDGSKAYDPAIESIASSHVEMNLRALSLDEKEEVKSARLRHEKALTTLPALAKTMGAAFSHVIPTVDVNGIEI